jgi:hypothetical protein
LRISDEIEYIKGEGIMNNVTDLSRFKDVYRNEDDTRDPTHVPS